MEYLTRKAVCFEANLINVLRNLSSVTSLFDLLIALNIGSVCADTTRDVALGLLGDEVARVYGARTGSAHGVTSSNVKWLVPLDAFGLWSSGKSEEHKSLVTRAILHDMRSIQGAVNLHLLLLELSKQGLHSMVSE